MASHVFLIAVEIEGSDDRDAAQDYLIRQLENAHDVSKLAISSGRGPDRIESWWIAEDDRRDRSDNDSAVFVPFGAQTFAQRLLGGSR